MQIYVSFFRPDGSKKLRNTRSCYETVLKGVIFFYSNVVLIKQQIDDNKATGDTIWAERDGREWRIINIIILLCSRNYYYFYVIPKFN